MYFIDKNVQKVHFDGRNVMNDFYNYEEKYHFMKYVVIIILLFNNNLLVQLPSDWIYNLPSEGVSIEIADFTLDTKDAMQAVGTIDSKTDFGQKLNICAMDGSIDRQKNYSTSK